MPVIAPYAFFGRFSDDYKAPVRLHDNLAYSQTVGFGRFSGRW